MSDDIAKIAIFQNKEIRKQIYHGEWWFVIADVIVALTDSDNPTQYLKNLRRRDDELSNLFNPVDKGGVQIEPPLSLVFTTAGGKQRLLSWNTEGVFRLIQAIPGKKVEPFKRWLARIGYERIEEIENPELAQKRMKALYRAKGYDDAWIERRVAEARLRAPLVSNWRAKQESLS